VPGGSFSYDGNDRLAIDTYDNNGNTVSSAGVANTYDFENRMLTHGGVTLVYDGDGNRVSETIGGTTTKYLIDNLNPTGLPQVPDKTVSGTVTRTLPAGRAERLCPDATFVAPDFTRYRADSRDVPEIFKSHTDLIEPLSLERHRRRCCSP
jgi:hypothetical protein